MPRIEHTVTYSSDRPVVIVPRYDGELEAMTWIAMSPGQVVEFESGGPDEEGYHYKHEKIEMCDHPNEANEYVVLLERTTMSRDCDGRLDVYNTFRLLADWSGWERISGSQRDYEAERMGY